MGDHISRSKANLNNDSKIYKAMFEIGIDNFYIELLHLFPCDSNDELNKEEGRNVRELDTYNNEWRHENKDHLNKKKKEWAHKHVKYNRSRGKIYYEKTKEDQHEYYFKRKE